MAQQILEDIFSEPPALFLAPLARTTESSFRRLCKSYGAALLFTEMTVAHGIVKQSSEMYRLLTFHPSESPIAIQLTGHTPELMHRAVEIVCRSHKPTIVDINAGCPVNKICSRGGGAALLEDGRKLATIIESAVAAAGSIPVSVKMRANPHGARVSTVEAAKIVQESGAAFITLHARTRSDPYSMPARWDEIGEVKSMLSIPVVGNGDIFSPSDALSMYQQTGCDGIMIARGALGQPWIFSQTKSLLSTGTESPQPGLDELFDIIGHHCQRCFEWMGEFHAVPFVRKHLCWYTRSLKGCLEFRDRIFKATRLPEFQEIIQAYHTGLSNGAYEDSPPDPLIEERFRSRVAFWARSSNLTVTG